MQLDKVYDICKDEFREIEQADVTNLQRIADAHALVYRVLTTILPYSQAIVRGEAKLSHARLTAALNLLMEQDE